MDDDRRASHADRDRAAAQLRAHYLAGRLTRGELGGRLGAALDAVTLGALTRALSGLPAPSPVPPGTIRLERRYRRLLGLYPAGHRRLHGEEMLAVLLASAPAGRDRPGPAATADLIAGALRVRSRAAIGRGWRAAVSLACAGAVAGLLAGIPFATVTRPLPAASHAVIFDVSGPLPAGAGQPGRYFTDLAAVATSYRVLEPLAQYKPDGLSEQAFAQHVSASVSLPPLQNEGTVTISVQARTAAEARAWAVEVAEDFSDYLDQLQSTGALTDLRHGHRDPLTADLPADFATSVVDPQSYGLSTHLEAPGPASSDVGETSARGALAGALLGAIAGLALSRRRRLLLAHGSTDG